MAPEDLKEQHGAQTPRHTGPWGGALCTPATHMHTSCRQGGGGRV